MTMDILVRCDGFREIGMGHITECIALSGELAKAPATRVTLVSRAGTEGAEAVRSAGLGLRAITFQNEDEEVKEVRKIVDSVKPALIITSFSSRSPEYYKALRTMGAKLAVIFDDGHPHPGLADVVVDYCLRQEGPVPQDGAEYLLGPSYCLINPSLHHYWSRPRPEPEGGRCRRIFINQGGSDPFGLTVKILRALAKAGFQGETATVMGAAVAPDLLRETKALAAGLPFGCEVSHAVAPEDLFALMDGCDAAISAGGNTLYELCAMGLPTVIVGHHERHETIAVEFQRFGAAHNLGIGPLLSEDRLAEGFQKFFSDISLRRGLARRAKDLVDGRGCARTAEKLLSFLGAKP
jgi:UDP-2,4-diacetamido-2,4,6-trideoxy-beta-L-altropyranose hydrolase